VDDYCIHCGLSTDQCDGDCEISDEEINESYERCNTPSVSQCEKCGRSSSRAWPDAEGHYHDLCSYHYREVTGSDL